MASGNANMKAYLQFKIPSKRIGLYCRLVRSVVTQATTFARDYLKVTEKDILATDIARMIANVFQIKSVKFSPARFTLCRI